MGTLALFLLICSGWIAWRIARRGRQAARWLEARGIGRGAVTVWQDLVRDPSWSDRRTLHDPRTSLRGTVDHAYRTGDGRLVISEVKTVRRLPRKPHESDLIQVGSYFLLCAADPSVQESPQYGLLVYRTHNGRSRAFTVQNTMDLQRRVLDAAHRIRRARSAGVVRRSHAYVGRCYGCGWRRLCPERLI